ncbi:MAG: hypothetical protein M3Z26_13575 [Bacteroidota bacterium]|nr:hypothetical protein [Bacteroidota bacterium]
MKKTSFLIFFFSIFSLFVTAQKHKKFQIKLRESFQSEDTKPEPATFTFTKPKTGNESFLIDAALGVKLISKANLSFSLFGEYHRNTLIDVAQNVIQGGTALEWFTNKTFNVDDQKKNSSTAIINLNGKYSKDVVAKAHSLQFTGEVTPLFLRKNSTNAFLPNDYHNHVGKAFDLLYIPAIGFEDQYTFQAANDSAKGNVLRAVAKLYIGLRPLPQLLKSKIELFGSFNERYDVANSTKYNTRSHPLIQTGINFIIFEKNNQFAKIGASYNKGSNPAQGLIEQHYYLMSLKVKI